MLPVSTGALPVGNKVMAVAMVEGNNFQIIVSNVDVVTINLNIDVDASRRTPTQLTITIPTSWLRKQRTGAICATPSAMVDNVFAQIKRDFADRHPESILETNFSQCVV